MSDVVDQPPPKPRPDLVPVWSEVIAELTRRFPPPSVAALHATYRDVIDDMTARDALGRERYGTPLTTNNGRDHVVDMYQELLDAVVYMKAAMLEGSKIPLSMYSRLIDDILYVRNLLNERAKKPA